MPRSTGRRGSIRLIGLISAAACVAAGAEPAPDTRPAASLVHPNPAVRDLMKEIAKAFDGIERGLAAGDPDTVSIHSGALESALSTVCEQAEALDAGASATGADTPSGLVAVAAPEPSAHARRAQLLSHDLAAFAHTSDLSNARRALEEVRRECVSCHVKLRTDNESVGLFPATGNTLSGVVRVAFPDSSTKEDASNVVVFLDGVSLRREWALPVRNPVVSQRDRRFVPRVLPILRGTTVDFPNDDTIFHNVFSLSTTRPLDLGVYDPGTSRSVTFTDPGLVKVYCNIHPSMALSILVLDNPLFAATDREGSFVITGIPDGSFVLRTWHELGSETSRPLTISGPRWVQSHLTVIEDRIVVAHRNKFGKPYPEKYR
jgi:plastocyanin